MCNRWKRRVKTGDEVFYLEHTAVIVKREKVEVDNSILTLRLDTGDTVTDVDEWRVELIAYMA